MDLFILKSTICESHEHEQEQVCWVHQDDYHPYTHPQNRIRSRHWEQSPKDRKDLPQMRTDLVPLVLLLVFSLREGLFLKTWRMYFMRTLTWIASTEAKFRFSFFVDTQCSPFGNKNNCVIWIAYLSGVFCVLDWILCLILLCLKITTGLWSNMFILVIG